MKRTVIITATAIFFLGCGGLQRAYSADDLQSVEIFNKPQLDPDQGILPQGVIWNRPVPSGVVSLKSQRRPMPLPELSAPVSRIPIEDKSSAPNKLVGAPGASSTSYIASPGIVPPKSSSDNLQTTSDALRQFRAAVSANYQPKPDVAEAVVDKSVVAERASVTSAQSSTVKPIESQPKPSPSQQADVALPSPVPATKPVKNSKLTKPVESVEPQVATEDVAPIAAAQNTSSSPTALIEQPFLPSRQDAQQSTVPMAAQEVKEQSKPAINTEDKNEVTQAAKQEVKQVPSPQPSIAQSESVPAPSSAPASVVAGERVRPKNALPRAKAKQSPSTEENKAEDNKASVNSAVKQDIVGEPKGGALPASDDEPPKPDAAPIVPVPSVKLEQPKKSKESPNQPVIDNAKEPAKEPDCVPEAKQWRKTCAEANYPASFTGQVVGETRTGCPAGNTEDIWLSDTCAPGKLAAGAEPKATDLQEEPKPLADMDWPQIPQTTPPAGNDQTALPPPDTTLPQQPFKTPD